MGTCADLGEGGRGSYCHDRKHANPNVGGVSDHLQRASTCQ